MTQENFTTPVGRLVQGSLYKANDKDADGNIRVYKTGPNQGKPRPEYYVALAIPKDGRHWAATEWGAKIWNVGHKFMATAGQMPTFAWKIRDGDSTVPNRKSKRPCDQEGFPGSWVLSFASGFAPKCYTLVNQPAGAPLAIDQVDAINLGDYAQINANVDDNASQQQPGVYLNLAMVCLAGYGTRIVVGPDVASAGFGGAPLPAGASLTPPAGFAPPMTAPAIPGTPAAPSVGLPPAPTYPAPALPAAAASTIAPPQAPNPAFLAPGAVPPVPGMPPMPPVAPAHVMLPKAGGVTYEAFRAVGWTDEVLRREGMMA